MYLSYIYWPHGRTAALTIIVTAEMGYQPYFLEIYFCYVFLNVDLYGNKTKPNQTKPTQFRERCLTWLLRDGL